MDLPRGSAHFQQVLWRATDCQLAYSYNGWHFQRTVRQPLFPNPEFGAPGAGTLRPISLLVHDRQIRIYSSASFLEHGHHVAGHDPGALLMHRLRLDGFVYLESTGAAPNSSPRGPCSCAPATCD